MGRKQLRRNPSGAFMLEQLDHRVLLSSYATADYYPITPGQTWKFNIVDDGVAGTSTSTTKATTYNGISCIAFVENKVAGGTRSDTEYQTFSPSKGVRILANYQVE